MTGKIKGNIIQNYNNKCTENENANSDSSNKFCIRYSTLKPKLQEHSNGDYIIRCQKYYLTVYTIHLYYEQKEADTMNKQQVFDIYQNL